MCALCLNQLRIVGAMTPEWLADEFGSRIVAIGRILPMLAPWDDPIYVTRAWCLFELFTAIRNQRDVEIEVILPPSEKQAFAARMTLGNCAALELVLDGIRAEGADASQSADLEAIRGFVTELPGGFQALNETVRGHLRRWFEGQGAVLSSARVQTLRRSLSEAANNDRAHARLLSDSGRHAAANASFWLESRSIERGTEEGAFGAPTSFRNPLFSVVLQSEYEDDTETVGLLQ